MPRPLTSPPPSSVAVVVLALLALGCAGRGPARPALGSLTTVAERSGWQRTGRHPEAVALCEAYAAAAPDRVRCERYGVTPEGRALVALVVGTPAPDRPVLLVQGGIHAGEIEGKDAGFWFLRDLLAGRVVPGALDRVAIVFVPILNPDGHERFGPQTRPNQRGPVEAGMRTTAANLNLNRDHMKVDAPEMAALLGLWRRHDPTIYVDLHTTDGAKFEHDVAVMIAPRAPRPDRLGAAAVALSRAVQARLTALGHLPLDFYPSFVVEDDPASGIDSTESSPRFSQSYAAARGRLGVLVETHSWRTYPERVRATYDVLRALVERAAADGAGWRAAAREADAADAALAGREVVLARTLTGPGRLIDFRGYRYRREPSAVSGAMWTTYDEGAPQVWSLPLRDALEPSVTVTAPRAGYLVEAGHAAAVAARLDAHGLAYRRLDAALTADVEAYRATAVTYEPPFEGRTRARITGAWGRERRTIAAGALFVPIAQPRGRLVLHLFEPSGPDSLAHWGFFNAAFEQKEYLEAYVAEEVARGMLADPAVRAAFDEALRDPAFAASPQRRLEFFYRRHPSWDERKDRLPVFRVDVAP